MRSITFSAEDLEAIAHDRYHHPDPRVRSNAVEANWQHKDEAALTLFNTAMRDAHHRVIGNGAVGLYYAGDVRCDFYAEGWTAHSDDVVWSEE